MILGDDSLKVNGMKQMHSEKRRDLNIFFLVFLNVFNFLFFIQNKVLLPNIFFYLKFYCSTCNQELLVIFRLVMKCHIKTLLKDCGY